jgi:hypothetical protein
MIYRQLHVLDKSQPIAPKYEIKPGAQHRTLRGRKHIYKNIFRLIGDHMGSIRQYIQLAGNELKNANGMNELSP